MNKNFATLFLALFLSLVAFVSAHAADTATMQDLGRISAAHATSTTNATNASVYTPFSYDFFTISVTPESTGDAASGLPAFGTAKIYVKTGNSDPVRALQALSTTINLSAPTPISYDGPAYGFVMELLGLADDRNATMEVCGVKRGSK